MPNIRGYSLALFGQIDQEAIDADKNPGPMNDAVLATIENFLPNSTGWASAAGIASWKASWAVSSFPIPVGSCFGFPPLTKRRRLWVE